MQLVSLSQQAREFAAAAKASNTNRPRGNAQDIQPGAAAHDHQPGAPGGRPTFARDDAKCHRQ